MILAMGLQQSTSSPTAVAATMVRLSRVFAAFSILAGALVLLAWKRGLVVLITAGSDHAGMATSTALDLVLCGLSLWAWNADSSWWTVPLRRSCAFVAILVAALAQLSTHPVFAPYVRQNLFTAQLSTPGAAILVRMAPNTALCLVLIGLASLVTGVQFRGVPVRQWAALLAAIISLIAAVGYAYDVRALYGISGYTQMAPHSALTLLLLSIGFLFSEPRAGLMAVFSQEGPAGTMVRRLFPTAILAPLLAGWLCLRGHDRGFYGTETALVLYAAVNVIFLTFFLYTAVTSRTVAEEKFRGLVQNAPDPMVIVNPKGEIVHINQQTEIFFGYSRDELLGKPVETLVPARLLEQHARRRAAFSAYPGVRPMGVGLDLYGRRKDGSEFPVEISLAPLKTDGGTLISSTIRDVTDRKRAETALRESEERYRRLFENSLDGVLLSSPDGSILDANPSACRIFGRTREEIIREGREGVLDTADPRLVTILEERARTGRASGELTCRHKDGSLAPIELSSVVFHDSAGEVRTWILVRDITDRKMAENERERLIVELQEALRNVRMLRGLLPICASCKKIRDEKGQWNEVERYIKERSSADFTHGICPDCARRLYPEYYTK